MKANSYYVGLDIGTNSVGWSVTDTDLNLIKAKNQNFWGARIFDAGKTAEDRRLFRGSRRRLDRRKRRIELLRIFLKKEMNKVDTNFFNKMNNSWVSPKDDDRPKGADFVFEENQKKEKENYYSKFPTIWHLRKYLIETSETKIDIRWIYLAVHHIIKHRGNFLYTDSEFQNTESAVEDYLEIFIDYLEESYEVDIDKGNFIKVVKNVLLDTNKSTAEKKDYLKKELNTYKPIKRILTQFINAILGYKTSFHTIFEYEEQNIRDYIKNGVAEDEKFDDLRDYLGPNEDVLDALSHIYSWSVLRKLLPDEGNQYISREMVRQYEEYGRDLNELKELFGEYTDNKNKFFKSTEENNNYFHYNLSKNDVSLDDLYKTIDKMLPSDDDLKNDERYKRYLKRKEDMSFLKVQNTTDKGAIPHQLHLFELNKILENQLSFYPFLSDYKEEITSILTFRIPYYVGPLNSKSEFSWIKRKDDTIYPWNFDEIVDREASEEAFINEMVGNCTYLTDEKALPLESLTYQEYILLNELNTVRVNNHRLDIKTKKDVVEQLFKTNKSVTITKFKKWLDKYIGENNTYNVTGLSDQTKFNGTLSSWVKFSNIGFDLDNPNEYAMAEKIVQWGTIFSDKQTLKNRVRRENPEISEKQLRSITQMRFKGWGRLSDKLLTKIQFTLPNNQKMTIIERMRETNDNFMQIINNKDEGFKQQLEEKMLESNKDGDILNQIQELPGSPAIKKGIHQAVLLVEEITKIMGNNPEKVFLEFARENRNHGATKSRYNRLNEIYKQLKKENSEYINLEANNNFGGLKDQQDRLDNERIFLYFMQNGKCLYSGRDIDWEYLDSSEYEVDHIMPRSYTKDNSFSNKALVLRTENQRKKDNLLLDESIIEKNKGFWNFLQKKNLISEKKYRNLTRTDISLRDRRRFINRQLVETRQISKHVKNLLIDLYPETKIQSIKAQFVGDYRRSNNLYKLRSLNDYHHAHDAYLSIFLGDFIDRRIPWINNFDPQRRKEYDKEINKIYQDRQTFNQKNRYGVLELINKDSDRANWDASEQNLKVRKYLNYKDCFITHKAEQNNGEFYNQLAIPADDNKKKIPLKEGLDPEIYGGYTGQNSAYFSLVQVGGKIKPVRIPIQVSYKIKNEEVTLKEYIEELEADGTIVRERVLVNTVFEYNRHPFIARSSSERWNGKQLLVPKKLHKFIYSAEKEFNYKGKIMDFENYLNILLKKLNGEFQGLANSDDFIKLIEDNYNELLELDYENINHFVTESLNFFRVNSQNPNFKIKEIKDLKSKRRLGRMNSISSNWKDKVTIIDQSITGYYESRLTL